MNVGPNDSHEAARLLRVSRSAEQPACFDAPSTTAALFGGYNLVRGTDRLAPVLGPPAAPCWCAPRNPARGPGRRRRVVTARAVRFLGSHCELEIRLPETAVRGRAAADWGPGAAAIVSVAPSRGWDVADA